MVSNHNDVTEKLREAREQRERRRCIRSLANLIMTTRHIPSEVVLPYLLAVPHARSNQSAILEWVARFLATRNTGTQVEGIEVLKEFDAQVKSQMELYDDD